MARAVSALASNFGAGTTPQSVAVGDFNGDGKQDLATANSGSNNLVVLLRQCLPPILVTNTNDSGGGSLRQAILDANATPDTQTIAFNIPGAGVHTIAPLTALPTISDPVVIDGYTQPGASANTSVASDNAVLLIEINGINTGFQGLNLTAGNSIVRGLVINRFQGGCIRLLTNGSNIIAGNFLGSNAAGIAGFGSNNQGLIVFSSNNVIGGTTPQDRNLISGASSNGMVIGPSGPSTNNRVEGNFIGTNVTGAAALPNPGQGIFVFGANNVIGGTSPGARNIISGNGQSGVAIDGATATGNRVEGNYIGTNSLGTAALGNGINGVSITEASNNVIGGTTSGSRNIISGNGVILPFGSGVFIGLVTAVTPNGNVVQGNFIGTDVTGMLARPNSGNGISLQSATMTTIGGSVPGSRKHNCF